MVSFEPATDRLAVEMYTNFSSLMRWNTVAGPPTRYKEWESKVIGLRSSSFAVLAAVQCLAHTLKAGAVTPYCHTS
jgi:hypothetical protein